MRGPVRIPVSGDLPAAVRLFARNFRPEHRLIRRVELNERRVGVVEFFWICQGCGAKVSDKAPSRLMTEFIRRWRSGEPRAKGWREA